MPTSYRRVLITRTPQVEKLIAAGQQRWPGLAASATLVALASEAVAVPKRSSMLKIFTSPKPLTADVIADALNEN
ncbi:MAG: hypothetical protein FWG47_02885 [Propionibacteriaceae bacterium]|nr:hypothetical protein [Propionibacteriaceae bacterium]